MDFEKTVDIANCSLRKLKELRKQFTRRNFPFTYDSLQSKKNRDWLDEQIRLKQEAHHDKADLESKNRIIKFLKKVAG